MPLPDMRESMFLSGCLTGNTRRVAALLEHGVDVNCVRNGRLGLLLSVRPGQDATMTRLLLGHPDIDVCKVRVLLLFLVLSHNLLQILLQIILHRLFLFPKDIQADFLKVICYVQADCPVFHNFEYKNVP